MTKTLETILLAILVVLTLIATPGCFDLGGSSCWLDANGEFQCDVDLGLGNGLYSGTAEDSMWIMWESKYAEQAYDVSYMEVTCIFDSDDGEFSQTADIYTDGVMADIMFYGVPSHFDAECYGEVAFNNGPPQPMFSDEVPQGDVLVVQWEDEEVQSFHARNNELDIDND